MRTIRNMHQTLESNNVLKRFLVSVQILLLAGTLAVIVISAFALSTFATTKHTQAAQRDTQKTTYESIRINGGDSLWSIAQEYHGIENTADFVEELRVLNNLSSDRIQSGSYLLVPVTSVL